MSEKAAENFDLRIINLTDERSYLAKLDIFWKLTIGGIILASYIWGTLMKCIIYNFFSKSGLRSEPFNLDNLIILQAIYREISVIQKPSKNADFSFGLHLRDFRQGVVRTRPAGKPGLLKPSVRSGLLIVCYVKI